MAHSRRQIGNAQYCPEERNTHWRAFDVRVEPLHINHQPQRIHAWPLTHPVCKLVACRFLALGPGTTLADLMGTKGPKKGGMKGAKGKSGPVKELSAAHSDGRRMTVLVQVCVPR